MYMYMYNTGCFELSQVLMAKDQFGQVVTKRTVVYYGYDV
jgi:hypothetical protein